MTAVKIGDDVFIIDCGFYLPGVIELQEQHEIDYTVRGLRRVGGIPEDRVLDKPGWKDKVKAIFISHAHLDHVAGLPFLIDRYPNAIVYATPYTMKVLDSLIKDAKISVRNKMQIINANTTFSVPNTSSDIKIEFVHSTHSTLDCAFVVIHSGEGTFFYSLDHKFDDTPTQGAPPNYSRLKEIGDNGVKAVIMDTLYSAKETSNGSEKDADLMLEKAFEEANVKGSALFITTFSSHIERLTNIVKYAKKTNREIVFLGRSLAKYVQCAKDIGKCPFENDIRLVKYRTQVNTILKRIDKDRGNYVVVCTGHQGERGSILDRIARGETNFRFQRGDHLIYSSSVIPTEVNIEARKKLDQKLTKAGVTLQINVHVHGHGSKSDKVKLIELLKPRIIIPAHGNITQEEELICVAEELGYKLGKTSRLVKNGEFLTL